MLHSNLNYSFILIIVVLLFQYKCNYSSGFYDYKQETYLDTIIANDTISITDTFAVNYYYPAGSNILDRIEANEYLDTIFFKAITRFYYKGEDNAHGSGVSLIKMTVENIKLGKKYIHYIRYSDTAEIILPIFLTNNILY